MGENKNQESSKISQFPGFQRNLYKTKLLMLYLQRGLKNNRNFELGTEIEKAHKFDDLFLKYKKDIDGEEKDHFVVLQLKHRAKADVKITYSEIFTNANNDFGLVKYYNAYKKAKKENLFQNGEIEYAVFYTNAKLDMHGKIPEQDDNLGTLKNINNITNKIKVDQNNALSLCETKEGKYYQFKSDLILPVLKGLLSVYHIIAHKLIKILTDDKKYLTADDEVLKHYDCLLVKEVIDVNTKKLRTEFIKDYGNYTKRQKLRNALNEIAEHKKINLAEIIGNKLNIKSNFGKKEKLQNWPEDIVDADVEEFLKKFVYATEQPNKHKLGEIFLSELGDQYTAYDTNLIYSHLVIEIQKWMTGGSFGHNTFEDTTKYRFISTQDAKEVFITTKAKINRNILKGPTTKYDSYFEKNDIEFDDSDIQNRFEAFLKSSDTRILSIFSEHIIISSIKLYKELTKIKELEEYIYVRLSSLNDKVIDAFESKFTNHLLVIELDFKNTKDDDWKENISKIIDIIQRINEKKLIIISNQKNVQKNILSASLKIVEINDDANTLKNLTEDSQKHFLNTDIKFQGCSVKLNDLIINNDLKRLINGEMLLKILENKSVEIGQKLKEFEDDINDYIERTFTCEIKCNKNVYLIYGINESDFYSENKQIDIIENPELITENESYVFERASKENKSMNIYLLRKIGNILILLKKSKATFNISIFLNDVYRECEVRLISAVAGMGKSIFFTYMSKKFKEHNPTFCVIKIDLNSVSSELNNLKDENIKFEDAINFLHHESELDRAIFKHYLQTGRVMLYLDTFDEISDDNKQKVLKMITSLRKKNKISKIWMNTRPNDSILQKLKDEINDTPLKHFKIEPFTQNDQKKYFANSWRDLNKFNNIHFETYIKELFKFLNETINDQQYEFLGITLHMKIISVALKDNFNIFLKSDSTIDERQNLIDTLQLSTLYKKIVEEKFKIHWKKKNQIPSGKPLVDKNFKTQYIDFVNQSIILAIDYLFNEELLKIFVSKEDINKLEEYKNTMKENGDKYGIVNKIIDNKPHFVHRTFAEYFTADFLLNVLMKEDERFLNIIEYFLKNLVNRENNLVCYFLNDMLNDKNLKQKNYYQKIIKELSRKFLYNVLKNNWQNIAIWLLENGIDVNYKDFEGNVLHLTCSLKNSSKLMTAMLEKLKTEEKLIHFINEKNSRDGYTPLNVAVTKGTLDNVKCMLNTYKIEKIMDDAFMNKNVNGENIFHLSASAKYDYTFNYLLDLASDDPVKLKQYFIQTNNEGNTPLMVAAYYGQLNKLKAVFKSNVYSEIKYTVFDNQNSEGQNVFHLVATKDYDDDLFIYLFNLARDDPVKLKQYFIKTDNYGNAPLKIAAADGQLNKLKAVLESNVDSEIKDTLFDNENSEGQNVFHLVANKCCDYETFIYLLNLASGDPVKLKQYFIKTDNKGYTPLKVAAHYGQLNKLKAVLVPNVDSEIKNAVFDNENQKGPNIFHLVADKYHNDDTFIYLFNLARGDPVKLKQYFIKTDNGGNTPLKIAAADGQLNKLTAVLESNVDSEIRDTLFDNENSKGQNVFHLVAAEDFDDTFIYLFNLAHNDLVKLKTYFIKTDYEGNTPLKVAASYGHLNKLKTVLESNLDSDIKDTVFDYENWKGQNVFHLAAAEDYEDDIFIYLFNLARDDPVKLKQYFIKTDNYGNAPLKIAAADGQLNKLKAVLKSNLDSEIRDTLFDNENLRGFKLYFIYLHPIIGSTNHIGTSNSI